MLAVVLPAANVMLFATTTSPLTTIEVRLVSLEASRTLRVTVWLKVAPDCAVTATVRVRSPEVKESAPVIAKDDVSAEVTASTETPVVP